MPNNTNAIEVMNLTKRFGDFVSVDKISFSVAQGSIFGFLGANGAGKSTTIKMLTGLLNPTSGDALVAGYSINKQPDKVKSSIGYMSQKFSLYNDLTVRENITFFGRVYGLDEKMLQDRLSNAVRIAHLEGNEDRLTGSLPGGIKQRLALATAVLHNPGIVFLDEPTSGVDPIARRGFWDLIHELSDKGITIFVTTHYLEEAEYCHNIILLDAGKIIAQGSPKSLKTDHLKFPILSIETDNLISTLVLLESDANVQDISVFGNTLHIITSLRENAEVYFSDLLSNNLITVKQIKTVPPTLEDVFIYLLEHKQ
ncbi:MAG: hypothetical protein AMXMBFR48_03110 [Ignavibacteriales bacterium]